MSKTNWKPGTLIYPLPAVLVSCGDAQQRNILTVAWTGTICTNPPMCYISVRKERHSHSIISNTGEFVINLTTRELARAVDWCGVRSGRDFDKFEQMQLTAAKGEKVDAPVIVESPLNIECKVREIKELGSHDMFIADVVNIQADEQFINPQTGKFDLERAQLIAYSHGQYYELGKRIGKFGWSVEKNGKENRRDKRTQKSKRKY